MRVYGLIPARLESSRLPRKLLLAGTGQPLIQYTWNAVCHARLVNDVIIATDDQEIATAARLFGARCEMTRKHPSGTDRIAEVVRRSCRDADVIVNVQGDEPEIDPRSIDTLVQLMLEHPKAEMATLAAPITDRAVLDDPSCTKVVCAEDGRALYFSRCPIPFCRDQNPDELLLGDSPWQLHLGIYAYRRDFLLQLTEIPPSRLERLEKLEQLRALEARATIQVGLVQHRSVGIDTPDDYARFVQRHRSRAA
jgi:3-deoxy-manno-octulosonate cytidylyltransferase (CMP-KDO synthetase)